jgi:hypothetical protein
MKKPNLDGFRAGLKTGTNIAFEIILALLTPFIMLVKHASLLVVVSWVALVMLSGKWTYNALSFSNTAFWAIIGVCAIEGAKNCLYAKKLDTPKKDLKKDMIVYIVFVTISILASTSDLYGQVNTATKDSLLNSVEYKQAEQKKVDIDKQIAIKEARLTDIKATNATKNTQNSTMTTQIQDYDAKIKAINDKITAKKGELTKTPVTPKTQRLRNDIQIEISELTTQRKGWETAKGKVSPTLSMDDSEAKTIISGIDELNKEKRSLDVTVDNAKIEGGFGNIPAALSDFFWFAHLSLKTWMCIWTIFLSAGIEFGMLRLYSKLKNPSEEETSIGTVIEKVKDAIHNGIMPDVEESWASKHHKKKLEPQPHGKMTKEALEGLERDKPLPSPTTVDVSKKEIDESRYENPTLNDGSKDAVELIDANIKTIENPTRNDSPSEKATLESEKSTVESTRRNKESSFNLASRRFKILDKPANIDDGDCKTYVEHMYNNQKKDGYSKGYQSIARDIGLQEEACRKIKSLLEQQNIVKVTGKETQIIVDKNMAYKILSGRIKS